MRTLAEVFRELNALKASGLVRDNALGGATAVLFYAEPARTYDVDVFVLLVPTPASSLMSLEPLYAWARSRGLGMDAEHRHVLLLDGAPESRRSRSRHHAPVRHVHCWEGRHRDPDAGSAFAPRMRFALRVVGL